MKNLILSYLSYHYEIDTSEIGNDGIYLKRETIRPRTPQNGKQLLKDMELIFDIASDYIKVIIEEWAMEIKKDLDLDFYWSDECHMVSIDIVYSLTGLTSTPRRVDNFVEPEAKIKQKRFNRTALRERLGTHIDELLANERGFFKKKLDEPYE